MDFLHRSVQIYTSSMFLCLALDQMFESSQDFVRHAVAQAGMENDTLLGYFGDLFLSVHKDRSGSHISSERGSPAH